MGLFCGLESWFESIDSNYLNPFQLLDLHKTTKWTPYWKQIWIECQKIYMYTYISLSNFWTPTVFTLADTKVKIQNCTRLQGYFCKVCTKWKHLSGLPWALVLTYFFNVFFSAKLYEVIFLLDKRENKNKDENLNVLQ